MKKSILITLTICIYSLAFSQEIKINSDSIIVESAESGCNCVDSINTFDLEKTETVLLLSKCIDRATSAYQMGSIAIELINSMMEVDSNNSKSKRVTINIDKDSDQYKKYYYEMERYMMENCTSLKSKVANEEKLGNHSYSENEIAIDYYNKGITATNNEDYKNAVIYFEKAVKEDPNFAFAWDNLGVSYRKLNDYDKAIKAYEKSLKIDPNGKMPLQNIAIAYQYKKKYKKSIRAYKRLTKLDPKNPESYYGIGTIYSFYLKDNIRGLDYLCQAYQLYIEQKSPYRTDAEKVINHIFIQLKEEGKEEEFNKILAKYNISTTE